MARLLQQSGRKAGMVESKLQIMFDLIEKPARNQVWWLESGRERCSACGHNYVHETGYYCEGCDGPICSICVEENFSVSVFCVECKTSEKGES